MVVKVEMCVACHMTKRELGVEGGGERERERELERRVI